MKILAQLAVVCALLLSLTGRSEALIYAGWVNPIVYSGGTQSCISEASGVVVDSGGCGSSTSYVYFDEMGLSIPDATTGPFGANITVFTPANSYEPKCQIKWCSIDGNSCSGSGYYGGNYESSVGNETIAISNQYISSGDYVWISCGFYGTAAIDEIALM
jgi:hypothetical protein